MAVLMSDSLAPHFYEDVEKADLLRGLAQRLQRGLPWPLACARA